MIGFPVIPAINKFIELAVQAAREWLPGIFGRVLTAWGVGLVTLKVAIPSLLGLAQSKVAQLPPVVLQYFYALGIDVCVTLILSAMAANHIQRAFLAKLNPLS